MKQDSQMDALLNCGNIIRGYPKLDTGQNDFGWYHNMIPTTFEKKFSELFLESNKKAVRERETHLETG